MTLSSLRRIDAQYRASATRAEALRVKREAAIIDAVRAGASQRDVARAVGLTEGRVSQIIAAAK